MAFPSMFTPPSSTSGSNSDCFCAYATAFRMPTGTSSYIATSNHLIYLSTRPANRNCSISESPKILDASVDQTRTQERLLTPEYASPEQHHGQKQTTATDVYSLGAVLRKLVTDKSARPGTGRL